MWAAKLLFQLFQRFIDQHDGRYFKNVCDRQNDSKRGLSLSPLEQRRVGAIEPGAQSEILLRELSAQARFPEHSSKRDGYLSIVQGSIPHGGATMRLAARVVYRL